MANERQNNWLVRFIRAVFWGIWPEPKLSPEESASTLFRFFRSEHIRDLQTVLLCAIAFFFLLGICVLIFAGIDAQNPPDPPNSGWVEFFQFVVKYLGPALGVTGLIIGWAYRSASARLGVVDLFACEISTLCRVGTIVDLGARYVETYEKSTSVSSGTFVSKEEYFPILQTNAQGLQLLEALVVNHITEFYTYMKSVRDSQRRLAETETAQVGSSGNDTKRGDSGFDLWHGALLNLIYMLFLAYESGRKAIEQLIEFQPSRAENRVVILITELKCYACLLQHFRGDKHHYPRLELRMANYKETVPEVIAKVRSLRGKKDWAPANKIIDELERRYERVSEVHNANLSWSDSSTNLGRVDNLTSTPKA
jgi:hypothetical protein